MAIIAQHADLFLILACIFGFFMAWGIGANDVANAMGTSVGSGAVKLWQALLIAAVFEFLGAWLAGGQVTETISKGLINPRVFADTPHILGTGMLAALLGAAAFLLFASVRGLPISTGQAIIGGILGFAVIAAGLESINWRIIVSIAISWVTSPIIAAILAFALFESIRRLVLASANPVRSAQRFTPWYVSLAAFMISLVTLENGLAHLGLQLGTAASLVGSLILGAVGWVISRLLLNRVDAHAKTQRTHRFRDVERIFGYAQIFTAIAMAFAHGSNDVANAMGPVAAVADVVAHPDDVGGTAGMPSWILILGGTGIVFGLATYGHKVMRTIGAGITELTPTRGFSAELAAATTVVLATWLGLPVSTTQTLVGAVLGVGLARGMRALDLSVLGSVFTGWVLTLPGAAFCSAICYLLLRLLIG